MAKAVLVSVEVGGRTACISRAEIEVGAWRRLRASLALGLEDFRTTEDSVCFPLSDLRGCLLLLRHHAVAMGIGIDYSDEARAIAIEYASELREVSEAVNDRIPPWSGNLRDDLLIGGFSKKRVLTPEQERDTRYLLALTHGANFSVPGAGKTTVLLAIHTILHLEDPRLKLLIVCPKNAFGSWDEEYAACFENPSQIIRLGGGADSVRDRLLGDPYVCMINYEQLRLCEDVLARWLSMNRVHLVLDESHRIKSGQDGANAGAALRLSVLARRRDIMSGTPMPQSLRDLEPQLQFLWPAQQVLGSVIASGHDGLYDLARATKVVRKLYTRTTKSELGLPELSIRIWPIQLPPIQSDVYSLFRSSVASAVADIRTNDYIQLSRQRRFVVRLLQAASNPTLVAGPLDAGGELDDKILESTEPEILRELLRAFRSEREPPAKPAAAEELTRLLVARGRKVLIWSAFVGNIALLEHNLADLGAVSIYGGVGTGSDEDPETREGRIRLFKTSADCHVLIGNPAACGEGISLHKVCHDALYVDRTFNAAHYLQSIDRIHRVGLKPEEETNVYILESVDTIDQVLRNRLQVKVERMSTILEDTSLAALAYDPEDVLDAPLQGIEVDDLLTIQRYLLSDGNV